MYIPAWQGFTLRDILSRPRRGRVPFPLSAPHRAAFHTARNAIYHLFRKLVEAGKTRVLAPDYHMGNEIRAIRAAGGDVRLYRIRRHGQPDLDRMRLLCEQGADILFTVHYAGWPQPIQDLRALCDRYGLILVEDCALALLSERAGRPLGSFGDYAVFCLYKTLPVIDGGLLVQNRNPFDALNTLILQPTGRAFEFGQAAELWVERTRGRAPRAGAAMAVVKRRIGALLTALHVERVPVGDIGFDPARSRIGMSPWSLRLLSRLDYDGIRRRRRANFSLLADALAQAGIGPWLDLEEGVCPVFFPLLVKDKSAAARALRESGVIATELWNEGDPHFRSEDGPDSRFLRRHLLELPIHQDVRESHIRYMARRVIELDIALPPTISARAAPSCAA
ncbi:MAG TPA: DegT/DnrJ/EryC1/StrS family aminotransferase [Nitrospira sp.]|nr:DegT/DnrJ/EryC1/StrS family aminotransferase [Nitrospira sp.]